MNLFTEPSWLKAGGLFSEPEIAGMRKSANNDAMMQLAMGLLSQSGYSTKPQTIGEGLASAVMAGQKAHRQAYRDALADKMTEAKMAQLVTANQLKALRPFVTQQVETAPGQFGLNLKTSDPVAQQMARENLAMAEQPEQIDGVLKSLQESAAYAAKPGDDIGAYAPTYEQRINPTVLAKYKQLAGPEQLDSLFKSLKAEQDLMRDEPVGQPQAMLQGGVPVLMQRYKSGALKPITNATPYQAPTAQQQNYEAAKAQGFEGTLLDWIKATGSKGTDITIQNIPPGNTPPDKKTRQELMEQIVTAGQQFSNLANIQKSWQPRFNTIPVQFRVAAANKLEKLIPGIVSPQEKQLVYEYSQWFAQAIADLNAYINQVTGAAIGTGQEEQRIRGARPDPNDGPTQYKAKLDIVMKTAQRMHMRAHYLIKQGLTPGTEAFSAAIKDPKLSARNIDTFVGKRADEIAAQMKAVNPNFDWQNNPEHEKAVREQLRFEFGFI